jgi:hypothetical protein
MRLVRTFACRAGFGPEAAVSDALALAGIVAAIGAALGSF